jgi:hypothetical protein
VYRAGDGAIEEIVFDPFARQGHQRRAAERLGLSYHQFRGLYRKHARVLAASSAGLAAQRNAQPDGPPVQAAPFVVPEAGAGGDTIDVARGPRG